MRFRSALAIVSLVLLVAAAAATAASTQQGGAIQVFVTPAGTAQGEGTILVTGAIGDYGRTTKLNDHQIGRARLKKGTFEVDLATVNAKANNAPPTLQDTATCSYVFRFSGPVKIMNGTGQYKGISGSGTITETFAAIAPRFATGPKKGQCNTLNNANPLAQWGAVTGSGTVSFT